jgi:hypothetical protein
MHDINRDMFSLMAAEAVEMVLFIKPSKGMFPAVIDISGGGSCLDSFLCADFLHDGQDGTG